jgi:hypothetical protein
MNNVRVFHKGARPGDHLDTHQIAHARVSLKLAALAFGESRHGVDSGDLCPAALLVLCQAAVKYVEELSGNVLPKRFEQRLETADNRNLRNAATAYASTRHGADSGQSFVSAGLARLCQSSIRYVEMLTGESKAHLVDPALTDGNG